MGRRSGIHTLVLARRRFCLGLGAMAGVLATGRTPAAARGAHGRYPDFIGDTKYYTVRADDTLLDLARRNGLGYTEIVAANPGIDPWVPGDGVRLVLPTAHLLPRARREGLVLNLADQRIYHFPADGSAPESVPIGIGRQGWDTPLGRTRVVRKKANPTWYVPESIRQEKPDLPRAVPPGPDNPLGAFALYLAWPAYLIHGTNNPLGVGRRVSHGCVRLYPEDIERLFQRIEVGTPVTVVDQPAKIGWRAAELLLEVHPSQAQADQIEAGDRVTPEPVRELEYLLLDAAGDRARFLDWQIIRRAVRERRGIPIPVFTDNSVAHGAVAKIPADE